ncbi:S41 family peptidase [Tenacibaculum jejuense]|uniref:Peptidase family S41 n=1 Tax=Tenacibaculum jejuense TaxID=584609 RepID=A0A238UA03_9FLAO|nr:S41 family peptidase [Tenacibaculum jejuense]SNR16027.1 Peptidase family S41 [Tenacibaculum jejuense]
MKKYFKLKILFLLIITSLTGCSKSEDIPQDVEINDFVWGGMNAFYKWQGEVPDLADNKFSTREQLNSFLAGFSSPDQLFNSLLYRPGDVDRFSWIVDDYVALENSFQGIRLTSGMKLVGVQYSNGSGDVYVVVRDVVIGSDADTKGITRGMIINEVNGTQLTSSNINDLLAPDSYTVSLADFNGGNPVANGTTVDIVKGQIQENAVKIAKVITQGSNKIGYLMYNQFSTPHDGDLNNAFATFRNEAITDLIIDLRYNGGGSVRSATYLASMISGQPTTNVFSQQIWNDKVMNSIDANLFINNFTNRIENTNSNGQVILDEAINTVNLSSVYFIVSDRTASASELVINGLLPYMDVNLVGTQTVGKQVGSITLYDSDDYTRTGPNFNNNHTWAMQPIVLEIQNSRGENEPNGYVPEVIIEEDLSNLGVLGDPTEPLLARTIQYITTGSRGSTTLSRNTMLQKSIWNSEMKNLDYNNMYIELK